MKFSLLALLSLTLTAQAAAPPSPGAQFQAFKVGTYSAIALVDGAIQEPNDGKSFVVGRPTAEVAAVLKDGGAPGDHFEFSIQPLLVHAGAHVLLFDTGAGNYFGEIAGKLLGSMAAAGENPATVTDIFISHAHGDHVGGLVTPAGMLAFPNATIHMSAPEWKWLSTMSAESAKNIGITQVTALVGAIRPKVVAFEPGADLLPGVVKAVAITGHTPGHSAYRIGSDPNSLLVFGDAMHSYVVSVREPSWKVAFDSDQQTGAASRAALVAQSAATGQRLYAEHFPFPGLGKIVKSKKGDVWVPETLH
ncbi:MAG: MBL fold metallo-hydrolase [Proteobacteria bacterium]|nr:MBL fold metallo-hydrolase [Pseudomonadota bacterium]